jgi:transcriptional regulator with XRE-family HTH domain
VGDDDVAEGEQADSQSLARKIDRLFRTIYPRGRGEYSFEEVAEAIQAKGGPTISATYLWQLRKGLRDNPTKHHLEALADFFGVSPAYFFDETATARIDAELDILTALRDAPVRQIAMRAFGLSPQSLRMIADMVERVRELEGLPDHGQGPPRRRGRPPREVVPPPESERTDDEE